VHEGAAKSELGTRTQVVVAAALRSAAGTAEGVEPRIHGSSGNGSFAGFELTPRRRCTEDRRARSAFSDRDDLPEARGRWRSELTAQELFASFHPGESSGPVPCCDKAADEKFVVSLFERIELEEARREESRRSRISRAQLRLGALQKQRLRGRSRVAALYGQPGLECRARGEGHPFEQLAGERINLVRLREIDGSKTPQIDLGTWLQR
jgi:hypothetical protein